MNAELLTRADLATLSMLTAEARPLDGLDAPTLFPDHLPSEHGLPSKLGMLTKEGFALKSDTGGPAKTRRTLWAITPEGQAVLDNYRKAHP